MSMHASQNDEIDLKQLAVKVAKFLRTHLVLVVVYTIIGIIVSIILGFSNSNVLQSKMVLYSDILTKAYTDQIGKNLNNLIRAEDNTELCKVLNISPQEELLIRAVDIDFIPEKVRLADLNADYSTLIITAEVTDKKILPKLQDALINYFRGNEFVKTRVENRKELLNKMDRKLGQEIKSLDSLKEEFIKGKSIGSHSDIALIDPSGINRTLVDLFRLQVQSKNDLKLVNSIQLVAGFSSIEKPTRLKLSLLIVFGFLGGFTLSMAVLGFGWLLKHSNPHS